MDTDRLSMRLRSWLQRELTYPLPPGHPLRATIEHTLAELLPDALTHAEAQRQIPDLYDAPQPDWTWTLPPAAAAGLSHAKRRLAHYQIRRALDGRPPIRLRDLPYHTPRATRALREVLRRTPTQPPPQRIYYRSRWETITPSAPWWPAPLATEITWWEGLGTFAVGAGAGVVAAEYTDPWAGIYPRDVTGTPAREIPWDPVAPPAGVAGAAGVGYLVGGPIGSVLGASSALIGGTAYLGLGTLATARSARQVASEVRAELHLHMRRQLRRDRHPTYSQAPEAWEALMLDSPRARLLPEAWRWPPSQNPTETVRQAAEALGLELPPDASHERLLGAVMTELYRDLDLEAP